MFLGAFHFDGGTDELVAGYDRLIVSYPPESLLLHVGMVREGGITVYDACPSRTAFDEFVANDQFHSALVAAGLPRPRIEPLGEVHSGWIGQVVPA